MLETVHRRKFYADHEYAIYFISKVSFTKVITFPSTPLNVPLYRGFFHKGIKELKKYSRFKECDGRLILLVLEALGI